MEKITFGVLSGLRAEFPDDLSIFVIILENAKGLVGKGVKIEVGDMLPSQQYAERLARVPPAWDKAFEVNASSDPAMRASCVEFVLAGLYATDRISRAQRHGRMEYQIP